MLKKVSMKFYDMYLQPVANEKGKHRSTLKSSFLHSQLNASSGQSGDYLINRLIFLAKNFTQLSSVELSLSVNLIQLLGKVPVLKTN